MEEERKLGNEGKRISSAPCRCLWNSVLISDAGTRLSEVREKTSEPLCGFHSKAGSGPGGSVLGLAAYVVAGVAALDAEAVEAGLAVVGILLLLPLGQVGFYIGLQNLDVFAQTNGAMAA